MTDQPTPYYDLRDLLPLGTWGPGSPFNVADGLAWAIDWLARLAPTDSWQPPKELTVFWQSVTAQQFLDACQRYLDRHPAALRAPLVYVDENPMEVYQSGPRPDGLRPDVVVRIRRYLYERFVAADDTLLGVRVGPLAFVLVVRASTVAAVLLASLPHPTFEPIAELLPPVPLEGGT